VTEAIGKPALSQHYVAGQPYAPPSGAGWRLYNKNLRASASVPKPAQWSTDSYTMTAYDGVIVMALAATAAKSTSPAVWNASITAVTSPDAMVVHSYADGVAALHAGKKIDYVGAAGPIAFNQWHNSTGGFEIAAYQTNGNLNLVNLITAADLARLSK
jgi:ABC-type branched-subunit amino acid transport system substrate-binding protein